jgi:hypothetical protein
MPYSITEAGDTALTNFERDLNETKKLKPKRAAPLTDIKFLAMDKDLTSPPKVYFTKGFKVKVKDLDGIGGRPFSPARMANLEMGVHEDKNIIVPSFGATSALFTRHF